MNSLANDSFFNRQIVMRQTISHAPQELQGLLFKLLDSEILW